MAKYSFEFKKKVVLEYIIGSFFGSMMNIFQKQECDFSL